VVVTREGIVSLTEISEAAKPVEKKYPQTTAAEIGWRNDSGGQLERFGNHARGQVSIRKQLNWPREAVP